MNKETVSDLLENYLIEAQKLKVRSFQNKEEMQHLLKLIDKKLSQLSDDSKLTFLFTGEHAFHSGNYEKALANYMQARTLPNFEFFCYRTSAFVALSRSNYDKAKNFAEKALNIQANDYDTLKLYHDCLVQTGEKGDALAVANKIEEIENAFNIPKQPTNPEQMVENPPPSEMETEQFLATKLGVDLDTEKALQERINAYQKQKTESIQSYLNQSLENQTVQNDCLYILSGYDVKDQNTSSFNLPLLGAEKEVSGFFLRFNGKGIAVNPGPQFFHHFHQSGLFLRDIDFVIVTRDEREAYADIKKIYELNYQLNKISPELHVIHYYLNAKAFQDLSPLLKPHFKQERNTLHSLELFLDSPEVEKESLTEDILLCYFPTAAHYDFRDYQDSNKKMQSSVFGIKLEMKKQNGESIHLGYVSKTPWSPLLAHHLGSCDILIAGFGSTGPNDYGKLNYNENSLGYFGTYSLLEEIKPKLLLLTEFDLNDGDIRLEVTKKILREFTNIKDENKKETSILPADRGLIVTLDPLKVQCTISAEQLELLDVAVVSCHNNYGTLKYLSNSRLLFN